jgi:hypothetical protein
LNIEERETWAAVSGGFRILILLGEGSQPDFGGHVSREVTLCLFGIPVLLARARKGSELDTGVKFSSIDA